MGETTSTVISIGAIMLILMVFVNIFQVQAVDTSLNKVDRFLTKKVAIHRGFTEEVEQELINLTNSLNLQYSSFDFSGTPTEKQAWGSTFTIRYQYENNIIQRGIEYLGIPRMSNRPRSFDIVIMGR